MTFTDAGLKLIKEFEGCALSAYQDQGGVWTLGYGHTADVKPGDTLPDESAASDLLLKDIDAFAVQVEPMIHAEITDNQFSALVCFAFNLGCSNLQRSTLLHCLNTGHPQDASEEFLKWVKVNGIPNDGLLRRRQAERALFLS